MEKYTLSEIDTINYYGTKLKRIIYTDGSLGGYIEKEENLSHEGGCRVLDNAQVYGNVQVFGSALVFGNSKVFGDARVFGNAQVYDDAHVFGSAKVSGDAQVKSTLTQPVKLLLLLNLIEVFITITDDFIHIGCQDFKIKDFNKIKFNNVKEFINKENFTKLKKIIKLSI